MKRGTVPVKHTFSEYKYISYKLKILQDEYFANHLLEGLLYYRKLRCTLYSCVHFSFFFFFLCSVYVYFFAFLSGCHLQ